MLLKSFSFIAEYFEFIITERESTRLKKNDVNESVFSSDDEDRDETVDGKGEDKNVFEDTKIPPPIRKRVEFHSPDKPSQMPKRSAKVVDFNKYKL